MKKVFKFAGIFLLIVALVALFLWSLQSLRMTAWYCFAVIVGFGIYRYMRETIYISYSKANKVFRRPMSNLEKVASIFRAIIGSIIVGSVTWCIGYGAACALTWHTDYWELYLFGGLVIIAIICAVIWCIAGISNRLSGKKQTES